MSSPEVNTFEYAIKFTFPTSNNEAEYEAAIAGLRMCIVVGVRSVSLKKNSQLVNGQSLKGEFEVSEANMQKYVEKAKEMIDQWDHFKIQAIPRANNTKADVLSKLVSYDSLNIERSVMVEIMKEKSIIEKNVTVNSVNQQGEWFSQLVAYKLTGPLPQNAMEGKKLKRQANWYTIYHNELYKIPFSLPFLKCTMAWESGKILEEIHEGICENHIGGKALSLKALKAGFYWPSMLEDAQNYVKKRDKCQKFAPIINKPANDLQPILWPIPFAQWGLDFLGPFTTATDSRNLLLVGIDYFMKWIKAEPTTKIKSYQVKRLFGRA